MVKIFVCGDIVNYQKITTNICSKEIEKIIKDADYSICNFEAPIGGCGTPQRKSGIHHCQRPETLTILKKHGFDLILLANNHIMDYGEDGLKKTIEKAKSLGLETLGAGISVIEAYKPLILTIKGLRIALINACEAQFGVIDFFRRPSSAGYAWINHPLIDKTILSSKKVCDFVIVFCHAGLEHYSIPQKEWRERYRHFCDLGADVVVGSHPHVPQGFEKCGESLIFYSLGNFYFDSKNYKDKEDCSFALLLELEVGNPPVFSPIFHYKNDGLVELAPPKKQVDFEKLNLQLVNGYEFAHDHMSLAVYKQIKRNLLFSLMPFPFGIKIKSMLFYFLFRLFGKKKKIDKNLLQLHLMRNEAYHYAAKHALEVLASGREKII